MRFVLCQPSDVVWWSMLNDRGEELTLAEVRQLLAARPA
jgi:hypothetical protein